MISSGSIRRTVPDLQRELPIQDEHSRPEGGHSHNMLMFEAFSRAETHAWIEHFLHHSGAQRLYALGRME